MLETAWIAVMVSDNIISKIFGVFKNIGDITTIERISILVPLIFTQLTLWSLHGVRNDRHRLKSKPQVNEI